MYNKDPLFVLWYREDSRCGYTRPVSLLRTLSSVKSIRTEKKIPFCLRFYVTLLRSWGNNAVCARMCAVDRPRFSRWRINLVITATNFNRQSIHAINYLRWRWSHNFVNVRSEYASTVTSNILQNVKALKYLKQILLYGPMFSFINLARCKNSKRVDINLARYLPYSHLRPLRNINIPQDFKSIFLRLIRLCRYITYRSYET